jgi:putative modified peptide
MATNPKPLPREVVARLLDKLGSDDAFRELFVTQPAAALKQCGAPEPDDASRCVCIKKGEKLADKETIRRTSQLLSTELSALDLHVPQLIAR